MAFPASLWSPPSSSTAKFPINLTKLRPSQPKKCLILSAGQKPICVRVVSMSQFGEREPNKTNKTNLQIALVKEKLLEPIPVPVKELPWKKAGDIALKQLLLLGYKALKLSLIVYFVLSFFTDIIFSISRNRELVIPFGLLVGCLLTDVLKEALREMLPIWEEKGSEEHLIGIGCIFTAVKFISGCFPIQAQVFLLNVANGVFLQVLWLWRGLLNKGEEEKIDVDNSTDASSLAMGVKM